MLRRRGVARTRPWAVRLAKTACGRGSGSPVVPEAAQTGEPAKALPPIVLDLEDGVWAGVPCWVGRSARWVRFTVPIAYDLRYDTRVRPVLGVNQVSRPAVLAVAAARAEYAEYATGRQCRPTNARLAADTGLSVRTVQRADAALRLLGVATEVLRRFGAGEGVASRPPRPTMGPPALSAGVGGAAGRPGAAPVVRP